ncbi:MAG TPA: hypothetical protein DCE78_01675 [Bacteroidetes bacterium]|nr:hypothetical protein [Bacteroidota bacterium]
MKAVKLLITNTTFNKLEDAAHAMDVSIEAYLQLQLEEKVDQLIDKKEDDQEKSPYLKLKARRPG